MGNKWIGHHLEMGAAARVSRYCSETEGLPEVRRLMRRIEMSQCKDPLVSKHRLIRPRRHWV